MLSPVGACPQGFMPLSESGMKSAECIRIRRMHTVHAQEL